MGLYRDRVLPRITEAALGGKDFDAIRARVAQGLEGTVLEVGFGSGRNVAHLPVGVRQLLAVEPAAGGRRMAGKRMAVSPTPVDFIGLDGASLPLEDGSVDHALSTWTLCTIPDVGRALEEIRRVLRPGGTLHFAEHGLSPEPSVARWQDRLTPIQRRVAGGCHLNRPIDDLIAAAGLEMTRLETYAMPGPKAFSFTYEGVATKA